MTIQNFPAALQPIIQQGYLERDFEDAISSVLGYRQAAERMDIPTNVGETWTKTRPGLKAPVTTPMVASGNTNFDNGLSPSTWTIEQFSMALAMYGDTIDLNTVTNRVGIVSQFLHNAQVNGKQSASSLDRLARNKLFAAYLGGNTRVTTTLGAPGTAVAVDDITGFEKVMVNGVMTPVSSGNPLAVTINGVAASVTAVTADGSNVSTAFNGKSGVLTTAANVLVANATAGNAVVASIAPTILRPNARATTAAIQAGDILTMGTVLDAVAYLRSNGVEALNGYYNVHLDPTSGRQLFADPDFKLLFQGQAASKEFALGRVIELLDCRFIPTTEAPIQNHPTLSIKVRRPLVVGSGALIEGDFAGQGAQDTPDNAIISEVDKITMVTRPPMDRLRQIIAQSWYWIGDFCAPTDQTVNASIVPTASASYWKRAVAIETAG